MEFELYSGNFIGKHDPNKCDLIVCWINNWENPPQNIKILELKEVHKQLVAQKGLRLIFKDEQKHPDRKIPYTIKEFMDALKNNVGKQDFKIFYDFIEEIINLEFPMNLPAVFVIPPPCSSRWLPVVDGVILDWETVKSFGLALGSLTMITKECK